MSKRIPMTLGLMMAMLMAFMASLVQAAVAPPSNEYRLAGGDVIKVMVFQNPDLTTETRVSENGTITFPLVGSIKVGGLTLGQAEQEIANRLQFGNFVVQPQVTISLSAVVGNQVSILGQVNKPGSYPLLSFNMKLSQMLATAGGVSPTGADIAVVAGTRDGKPFRTEVDINDFFLSEQPQNDVVLAAGDSIYVPKADQFFIYGQVQRPGAYTLTRNTTVMQALAQGGGLTLRGSQGAITLFRKSEDGSTQKKKVKDLTELVRPDDVLNVGESLF